MQININLGKRIEMLIFIFETDHLYILDSFFCFNANLSHSALEIYSILRIQ